MYSGAKRFCKTTLLLLFVCLSHPDFLTAQDNLSTVGAQEVALTGNELWSKTIAYHDPQGKWATFSSKVHLVTTFSNGTYGEEEFEIRKSDDFYQSTRFAGKVKAVKGVRNGACFNAVDGNNKPSAAQIEEYGLDCEIVLQFMKEHQSCHFGLPMELKTPGVEAEGRVTWENFQGRKCYTLKLVGNPQVVKHPYYAGTWILYIDPVTYAMRGMRVQTEAFKAMGFYNCYIVAMGELEVGGIKMPQIRNYFREDDSYAVTDAFTFVKETNK
jgi:hypothetical protein